MKNQILCYIHFMYNEWNENQARRIFADAACGWEYIWQKWCKMRDAYGLDGAITMFYADGLDSNLQQQLANATNTYYNEIRN